MQARLGHAWPQDSSPTAPVPSLMQTPVTQPHLQMLQSNEPAPPHSAPCILQEGKPVEMENFFSRFGLDIIGKAVFNYDFDSLTHDDPVIQVCGGA